MPVAQENWVDEAPPPSVANHPREPYRSPSDELPGRTTPIPDPRIYHGIVKDLVDLIGPATESDPVAIAVQFLAAFGNALNRAPHYVVEGATHCLNLFVILVGATSKGRKGTSFAHVLNVMRGADDGWVGKRIHSGLSSGEGLIHAVRDPSYKTVTRKDTETGLYVTSQEMVDAGVDDKRLLALEPEFASTLRVMKRDGSTLSAIIRQAWDSGNIQTLTKNSPAVATGAHISIIGHITDQELRRELDQADTANGFLNRFLLVFCQRSKCLPDGGSIDERAMQQIVARVAQALDFGRRTFRIRHDADARALWHRVYADLSAGSPGLYGAATSRAEAQVTRLASIYAILDGSALIRTEHLESALAVWDYVTQSTAFVFGSSTGNRVADRIFAALSGKREGLTQSQINDLFSGNKSSREIAEALETLKSHGMARSTAQLGAGRPVTRWLTSFIPSNP